MAGLTRLPLLLPLQCYFLCSCFLNLLVFSKPNGQSLRPRKNFLSEYKFLSSHQHTEIGLLRHIPDNLIFMRLKVVLCTIVWKYCIRVSCRACRGNKPITCMLLTGTESVNFSKSIYRTWVPGRQQKSLIHLCIYISECNRNFCLGLFVKSCKNPCKLFTETNKDRGTPEERRTLASERRGTRQSHGLLFLLILSVSFLCPFTRLLSISTRNQVAVLHILRSQFLQLRSSVSPQIV